MNTAALVTGTIGITISVAGTILMFNRMKIDLSALKRQNEEITRKYSAHDAYVNALEQVKDAVKHTNEENRVQYVLGKVYVYMIIVGSIFQAISLVFS